MAEKARETSRKKMEFLRASLTKETDISRELGYSSPAQQTAARSPLHPILQLQRNIGNQAVVRLIESRRLQPKLKVSRRGYSFEQETDLAAAQVMRTESRPSAQLRNVSLAPSGLAQRKASKDDEDKKKKAQGKHQDQQRNVANLLDQARKIQPDPSKGTMDPDNLYHNSLEMIDAGKVRLSVLSPTHDAQTRKPRQLTYFDWRVKYPKTGGDYPADPDDKSTDKGLQFADVGDEAAMMAISRDRGVLYLFTLGPPVTADFLKRNLVHETQHFSDWHGPALRARGQMDSWKKAAEIYETEFRSFWIQPVPAPTCIQGMCLAPASAFRLGSPSQKAANTNPVDVTNRKPPCTICPPAKPSPAKSTGAPSSVKTNLKNERQEKIFWYILARYPDRQFDCCYVFSPEFRKEVDAYAIPTSINLINSVRLLELNMELGNLDRSMTNAEVSKTRFVELVRKLDALDWLFLKDQLSTPFWTALHLDAPALVRNAMANLAAQAKTPTVADIDRELGLKLKNP
jgi:hypothetical protein